MDAVTKFFTAVDAKVAQLEAKYKSQYGVGFTESEREFVRASVIAHCPREKRSK